MKYAFRSLRKTPGFTTVAILTLALGIGATTMIFSVTDALLFHVFPYRDADRLTVFRIHLLRPGGYDGVASPPIAAFRDFQRGATSFEELVGFWDTNQLYKTAEGAQQLQGAWVTTNTFSFLGVPAELGRGLLPGDDAHCVVSHQFWQEQLHSDPRAVGAVLNLNNTPRTVVGVMPPRFQFLGASIWIPLTNGASKPGYVEMIGRLKPGVNLRAATAEYDAFERRAAREYPQEYPDPRFTVSMRTLVEDSVGQLKPVLFTLFAAVTMLLLIACSNVANLLLVRATLRQREMAIRSALGASRSRLIGQLLVESGMLALASGLFGCLLASLGLSGLAALIPQRFIPGEAAIGIHPAALWFALGVTVATTLLCGLAPALQVGGANLGAPMARTSHSGGRLRSALVTVEVALSIVLLIGAGLMVRSFLALTRVDLGFNPSHLLSVELTMPRGHYDTATTVQTFMNDVVAHVRRLPGVAMAGVSGEMPPAERGPLVEFTLPARSDRKPAAAMMGASSEDHIQAMGRAIYRGRTFSALDVAAARQVLLINETFARTHFAGSDPIGQKVLFNMEHWRAAPSDPTFEIVGVVSDVRNQGVRQPVIAEAYVPYTLPMVGMGREAILVRTTVPPLTLVENIRHQVWSLDANVILTHATTMEQAITDSSFAEPRFGLVSLGGFAAVGLVLVVVGVFSVMAYTVSVQTRDIGVRMALGARQADILSMVLRRGLVWIGAGIAIGVPVSLILTRLLASQLWGVSTTDPWTFAAVTVLLLAAGSAACVAPARHAARVDPLVALRHE